LKGTFGITFFQLLKYIIILLLTGKKTGPNRAQYLLGVVSDVGYKSDNIGWGVRNAPPTIHLYNAETTTASREHTGYRVAGQISGVCGYREYRGRRWRRLSGESERVSRVGEWSDVEITYIEQGDPRGLADAVSCAQEYIGESPFLVCFGDTIIDQRIIKTMVNEFQSAHYSGYIPMQHVENPSRFGIAKFDGDKLKGLIEKPSEPPSDLAYMGAVVFTPKVFGIIEQITPSDRGELELTDAIDLLVKNETIQWESYDGAWIDVGTPEDLVHANAHMLAQSEEEIEGEIHGTLKADGPVQIGIGSVVEKGATVVGPVSIGEDVVITEGATVGPLTSVGDGSTLAVATVENSVLLENVTIRTEERIEESILGNNSRVEASTSKERSSVILGDNSSATF